MAAAGWILSIRHFPFSIIVLFLCAFAALR
jgi:hypothetical protein